MYRKVKLNKDLDCDYSIDTLGVVVNTTTGVPMKGTSITRNNRYVKLHLDKFYPLHRLVAEHFLPNPLGLPQVNHKDGNRNNNSVENLEWCSPADNVRHAYKTGLKSNKGVKNPCKKLEVAQVKAIWGLRNRGLTARQIRDRLQLEVGIAAVKSILQGKNWSHITNKLS